MNDNTTYKRVIINWWFIIFFGGIHVWMIFAYIHQWGTKPLDKPMLMYMSIIWFFVYIFIGRFKVIINDNYVIFRSDVWVPVKIPITMIKNVSVKQTPKINVHIPGSCFDKYSFDFVNQAVAINLKNGRVYQIAIKDAQIVKEDIEKRMLKPNNYIK
jgi:hypothetical protein